MSTEPEPRFVVRRRGDGYAVVDLHGLQIDRHYEAKRTADRIAKDFNAAENQALHTYGVAWYVEVDATDEKDAVKRARKYLAPSYRTDWEPVSVDLIDVDLIEPTSSERLCGRTGPHPPHDWWSDDAFHVGTPDRCLGIPTSSEEGR